MALVILDNSTKKLQVLLAGAVSTTELPLTASVLDIRKDAIGGREETSVGKNFTGITTGATEVDLVGAAPSNIRRKVIGFSAYNADSAEVTITIREYVDASTTRIVHKCKLQTLEALHYSEAQGWHAVDVNGNRKTNSPASSGAASTAESGVASMATRVSTAESVTTSGQLRDSTAASTATSAIDSNATRASVALSTTVSGILRDSTAISAVQSNDTRQSTDQSTMRSLLNSGGQAGF